MDNNLQGLSTIQEVIEYGKSLNISAENLFLKGTLTNLDGDTVIYNNKFILDDYWDFIDPYVDTITLTDEQYQKYAFNPVRLCFDIYGNGELVPAILRLNKITSPLEFTKRTVKIFKSEIMTFINEVLALERKNIIRNKKKIGI